MQRAWSAPAPEVNEKTDREINRAYRVLVENRRVPLCFADNDLDWNLFPAVKQRVLRRSPGTQAREHLGRVGRRLDFDALDRDERVASVDTGFFAGTAVRNINRDHLPVAIQPRDSVVRQVIAALLLEIDSSRDHERYGENHQQRTDELLLQFLHEAPTWAAETPPRHCYSNWKAICAELFSPDNTALMSVRR